jgi:hypothetical protein
MNDAPGQATKPCSRQCESADQFGNADFRRFPAATAKDRFRVKPALIAAGLARGSCNEKQARYVGRRLNQILGAI